MAAERKRLAKDLAAAQADIEAVERKLASASFVERAPAEIVAKNRDRLAAAQSEVQRLTERLAALPGRSAVPAERHRRDGGMTDTYAARLREIEQEIFARRPEHSINPSLERITSLVRLLGDPQRAYPVDPPDRHQRQDLDGPDDRGAAAGARPAHGPVHQPAPVVDPRAHLRRRAAAGRRAIRRRLRRDQAVPGHRRQDARRAAVVLRGARRHGVLGVRRRSGGRLRARGRHGRHLGQHQRGRRRRRRRHADLDRSRALPGQHRGGDRGGQGGHHQARRDRRAGPAAACRCRGAAAPRRRGRCQRRP